MAPTEDPATSPSTKQTGFYPFFGVNTPFDPKVTFVTARFLPPLAFGIIRLIFGLYAITATIVDIVLTVVYNADIDEYFSFFTNITYISLAFYFLVSGVETIWYSQTGVSPLTRWWRPFQLAHTVLFTTIITFPIVVTVVFWSLLSGPSTFSSLWNAWSNISKHALNSVFSLFEIFFSAVGLQPWSHIIWIIFFLACYLGVAYITYATQGVWVYTFLNPSVEHGLVAAYIVGILAGTVLVFAVVNVIRWSLTKCTHAIRKEGWEAREVELHQRDMEKGKSGASINAH